LPFFSRRLSGTEEQQTGLILSLSIARVAGAMSRIEKFDKQLMVIQIDT
jgi:hypothetical protein